MSRRSIAKTADGPENELARVVALYNAKRYAQALSRARVLRRAGSAEAARFEAHCLASLGRLREAVAALRRLTRHGGDPVSDNLALGGMLQRAGLPGAEECYRRALKASPGNAEAGDKLRQARRERLDLARSMRTARALGPRRASAGSGKIRLNAVAAESVGDARRAERLWASLVGDPDLGTQAAEKLCALLVARQAWKQAAAVAAAGGLAQKQVVAALVEQTRRRLEANDRAGAQSLLSLLLTLDDPEGRLFARARLFELAAMGTLKEGGRGLLAPLTERALEAPRAPTRAETIQLPLRQAEVALQSADFDGARRLWETALAALVEPLSTPERIDRYLLLVKLKRYAEAFDEAERALRAGACDDSTALSSMYQPWPVAAPFFRGAAQTFAEDKVLLEKLRRENRHGPWPAYLLARIGARAGEAFCDEELAEVARLARPRHSFMLRDRVFGQLQVSRFADAIATAARIADRLPESWSWSTLCYKAEALLCQGEVGPALASFDEAIARARRIANPREVADALAWKGEGFLWLGRYAEALSLLDEAAVGDAPYAHCWRGAALYKMGRLEPALESIERGLAVYDRDLEAYAWKGEILRRLGRLDEAVTALNAEALRVSGGGLLSLPLSGAPANAQYWTWHLLNRALVAAARGDEAGLNADVSSLLGERCSLVFLAAGVPSGQLLGASPGRLASILEGVLEAARGCRRPDIYSFSVWGRREALGALRLVEKIS